MASCISIPSVKGPETVQTVLGQHCWLFSCCMNGVSMEYVVSCLVFCMDMHVNVYTNFDICGLDFQAV